MAFEDIEFRKNLDYRNLLVTIDIVFQIIFLLEITINISADGLNKFMKSYWNILNFILLFVSSFLGFRLFLAVRNYALYSVHKLIILIVLLVRKI